VYHPNSPWVEMKEAPHSRSEGSAFFPVPLGRSQRLRFEPLVPEHALSLSEALLDPAAYAFISSGPPKSLEDLTAQIERRLVGPSASRRMERWWNIAVFSQADNLGLGRLEATLVDHRAEVAYVFGSEHWGNGYALEAMHWLQDRLVEDGTAWKFWATVLPANVGSVRLLQRLGYTKIDSDWPGLASYDEGDLVFCRVAQEFQSAPEIILKTRPELPA
jgi:RimJ/RimL family protein N-acetyltransferase